MSCATQDVQRQAARGASVGPLPRGPNILLIVADDTGFSDVGHWGSEIPTPNIDALAQSGVSFTNFHMSPVCSVSRAMFLTGADAHLIGLGNSREVPYVPHLKRRGWEGYLLNNNVTVARLLRDAGYHTYMVGKWHLGEQADNSPHVRGFEQTYVLVEGGGNHFNTKGFTPTTAVSSYRQNGRYVERPDGVYSTKLWTDKLLAMIDSHHGDGRRFFSYVAYTASHFPLQAPQEDIQKFMGKYDKGWDKLRAERFERMQKMGLITSGNKILPPRNRLLLPWDKLSPAQQKYKAKKMAIHAAMVANQDHHIGRIIGHLKKIGEYDNTVIIFCSDNGAAATHVDGPLSSRSVRRWVDVYFDNSYESLGTATSLQSLGAPWANAAVTPLWFWKGWITEGGTRVPFLIRIPGVTAAGTRTNTIAQHVDIAATVLDIAGVRHPGTSYRGRRIVPLQGKSMRPFLAGTSPRVHEASEPLGFELMGSRALIQGHWKITSISHGMQGDGRFHLYNLREDMAEQFPVEYENSRLFWRMIAAYGKWAKANNVLPIPDVWNPYSTRR